MCAVGLKRRRTFSPFFDCTGRRCAFCVPKIACQAQNAVALTTMLLYGKVVSGNIHLTRYRACRCTAMRAYSATCREMRGKRAVIGNARAAKIVSGGNMCGGGRYRRGRARDAGRKNGKKRSLSGARTCKRSRRALLRLTIRPV